MHYNNNKNCTAFQLWSDNLCTEFGGKKIIQSQCGKNLFIKLIPFIQAEKCSNFVVLVLFGGIELNRFEGDFIKYLHKIHKSLKWFYAFVLRPLISNRSAKTQVLFNERCESKRKSTNLHKLKYEILSIANWHFHSSGFKTFAPHFVEIYKNSIFLTWTVRHTSHQHIASH